MFEEEEEEQCGIKSEGLFTLICQSPGLLSGHVATPTRLLPTSREGG